MADRTDARDSWIAKVSEQLYFAHTVLDSNETTTAKAADFRSAAALHFLAMAYAAFVGEILVASGESSGRDVDIRAFLTQLPQSRSPEIARLAELSQGSTWLTEFLATYHQYWAVAPPKPIKPPVAILAVDTAVKPLTLDICREWLKELRELINTVLDSVAEF